MSRIFIQTYQARSLAELQETLLASLAQAQGTYAIQNVQISHAHESHKDDQANERVDTFSALIVLSVA